MILESGGGVVVMHGSKRGQGRRRKVLKMDALTEEAQYEEVLKKSLRDIYKTHPSGSGTVTKITPSATKIKSSVTNKGTGVKPGVPDVTEEESTESEAESWGRDEDETNIDDKTKGYKDEGMDYTTNQFDDDVNVRLNKPVTTNEGFIQKEGTDVEMTNVQQGNENPEITLNQVIEDAHVTLSTISQKTEVPVTRSSHSSDLASKFLNFSDIPHIDAKIVSPMDVHVHHEVPSNQTPTLLTVPILVITKSLPIFTTVILQSLPSFTPPS
ncbi:hypothetical protein Tco_1480058 [Tanacetum coccineum]